MSLSCQSYGVMLCSVVKVYVTPQQLIDRLLEVYDVAQIEDLRGKIPISVRTLQRWKQTGWPETVGAALVMLTQTGLLKTGDWPAAVPGRPDPLDRLAEAEGSLTELTIQVVRLAHQVALLEDQGQGENRQGDP